MAKPDITVLDCTLRDGGYYNDWDFDSQLVNEYLQAMSQSGVNVVEIGFRFTVKERFLGGHGYCSDEYLSSLAIPDNICLAVMVNASDLIKYPQGSQKAVELLFSEQSSSPVSLVRIAAHVSEVAQCRDTVMALRALGYVVGLNVMQASEYPESVLIEAASTVDSWNEVSVLYFADSLGNMRDTEIIKMISIIRQGWSGMMGIHAHNNMGQALSNTLTAIDEGTQWFDATVLGMGRGAGNAQMEHLLIELESRQLGDYRSEAIFNVVLDHFKPLQQQYNWGENLYYYLAAKHSIHPTYVQQMLSDERYSSKDILRVLRALEVDGATSFSAKTIGGALHSLFVNPKGEWHAKDWCKGKTILLLAGGRQLFRHREAILNFIRKESPLVVSLNYLDIIPGEYVDMYISCFPTRLMADAELIAKSGKTLITPKSALSEEEQSQLQDIQIKDFGMAVKDGQFNVNEYGCTLSYPMVIAYALAVVSAGKPNTLFMAGFDGYKTGDTRNTRVNETIRTFETQNKDVHLVALTPTQYGIEQRSVYMPLEP